MASGWWKSTHTNLALGSPVDFDVTTRLNAPRGYPKVASIATGAGLFLGGTPCITVNDVLYYAGDDYVQDTENPVLVRYDGRICTEVLEIPAVGATPAKAILSLAQSDDGTKIFISTWDSGTSSSDFAGRVFVYESGILSAAQITSSFTGGKLPIAMAWFNDALYVGVSKQNPSSTTEVIKIPLTGREGGAAPTPVLTGTTYTYRVGGCTGTFGAYAERSASVSTVNRLSLSSVDYNSFSWTAGPSSASYRVARTLGGSATGVIALTADPTPRSEQDTGDSVTADASPLDALPITITLTVTPTPAAATATYRIGAIVNGAEYISAAGSTTGRATLYSDLYVALSWAAVTGATSYNIYRTAGHTSTGLIGSTSSTSFNDTGLTGSTALPTFATSSIALTSGAVAAMTTFNSNLYIASYQPSGTFGKVFKITTGDVLSTSQTAAPGGTAQSYNGYTALIEFEDNLYAGYWNDDATDICLIQKYTGSAWSTVSTVSGAGARPWVAFCAANGTCYAYGGGDAKTGILYSSPTGAVWTDVSALLPSAKEAIPFMGNANLLGGF